MPVLKRILEDSPIPAGTVRPGDELVAINGQHLRDIIDAKFFAAEEELELLVRRPDGSEATIRVFKDIDAELGLEYEPDRIRVCKAKCDFCFVLQQPKRRMRRALYIKDDDYRLSFLHGNFITLTNMTEEDYARVFEQRLSPLYVSVHSTDDEVRRNFLRKPDAEPILPLLKRLHAHGIMTHAQIVVVPGLNDGDALWRSFDDLLALYPDVPSVGVVPIGLTQHREKLPGLPLVDSEQAAAVLREVDARQRMMRARHGVGVIYAADEMFLIADEPIPPESYYDDYEQIENGLGLLRQLLDGFDNRFDDLPETLACPLRLGIATGTSAAPFITDLCERARRRVDGLDLVPLVVRNEFWGEMVTVSGLLTGGDIADQFAGSGQRVDALVIPPECRNFDGLFLDDETIESVSARAGVPVLESEYDFIETLLGAISRMQAT